MLVFLSNENETDWLTVRNENFYLFIFHYKTFKLIYDIDLLIY